MLPSSQTSRLSISFSFWTFLIVLLFVPQLTANADTKRKSQEPKPFPIEIETLRGHGGTVKSLVFHPNGDVLYSGGHDAQVIGWNVAKIGTRKSNCHEIDRRQSGERISSLAFNKNGNVLAVSGVTHWGNGFGSALKIYTPYQEKPFVMGAESAWSFTSCDVDPQGRYVVMGARNNQLRVVALTTKRTKKKKIVPTLARIDAPGIPGPVLRVACHPNESVVAAAGEGGWVSLYDVTKKGLIKRAGPAVLSGSRDERVLGLKFSSDGRYLIVASNDHHLSVYDFKTGKRIRHFSPVDSVPQWIDVHPKNNWVIAGYDDNTARIINYDTKEVLAKLNSHTGSVKAAVFSADGKFAATGGEDQTVRIWDLQLSGKKRKK